MFTPDTSSGVVSISWSYLNALKRRNFSETEGAVSSNVEAYLESTHIQSNRESSVWPRTSELELECTPPVSLTILSVSKMM